DARVWVEGSGSASRTSRLATDVEDAHQFGAGGVVEGWVTTGFRRGPDLLAVLRVHAVDGDTVVSRTEIPSPFQRLIAVAAMNGRVWISGDVSTLHAPDPTKPIVQSFITS